MAALVEASTARDASDRVAGALHHHCACARPRWANDGVTPRELVRPWLRGRAGVDAHPMAGDPLLRRLQRGSCLSLRAKSAWTLGMDHAGLGAGDCALD